MAALSPLRRRMIEDMTIRSVSPATQRSYIHAVARFSDHFGRSPDKLTLGAVYSDKPGQPAATDPAGGGLGDLEAHA